MVMGIGLGLGHGGRAGVAVPTILLSNSSIAENAANGTTIGTLSVINGSGTYTFTETADPDTKFGVTGTNLNKTAALDYETTTSHSVTIHADNGAGSTLDRTFTISVIDIDDTAPTITSANTVSVAENSTLSHTLTANETVTWSIVGGADQAKFEISGSTLRWASNGTKNFEAPDDADTNNAYVVTVRATDTAANTTDQTITATVTNVNEAPVVSIPLVDQTATESSAFSYQFNSGSFTDPDAGTTITYTASLSPSGSLPAWLSFNSGTRTFSGTPTSGDVGTITVRVTASDGTLTVTDDFNIVVSAAAISGVVWNSADKDVNITLSGGNLTATHTAGSSFHAVRATTSRSVGKYMIEYELVTGGWDGALVGFGSSTASLTQFVGGNNQSLGLIDTGNAALYTNNAQLINLGTTVNLTNGSRVALAIDLDADKIWVQVEGSGWIGAGAASGDPAAGTNGIDISGFLGAVSGPVFPMMNGFYTGDSVTIVPSTFQHTIPSGFLAWDDDAVPAAPVLTWDGETTDATPDFDFDFDETSMVVGTVITWEVYSNSGLTTLVDSNTHTLTAPEIAAGSITLGMSSLANGSYWVRVKESVNNLWSNTEAITIGATSASMDFTIASNSQFVGAVL